MKNSVFFIFCLLVMGASLNAEAKTAGSSADVTVEAKKTEEIKNGGEYHSKGDEAKNGSSASNSFGQHGSNTTTDTEEQNTDVEADKTSPGQEYETYCLEYYTEDVCYSYGICMGKAESEGFTMDEISHCADSTCNDLVKQNAKYLRKDVTETDVYARCLMNLVSDALQEVNYDHTCALPKPVN